MQKIILICLFFSITACTSITSQHSSDNSEHQGKAKLLFDKTSVLHKITNGYSGHFISVRNSNGESIVGKNSLVKEFFFGKLKELYLNPGTYKIIARCEATNNFAYPFVDITVAKNDFILFSCEQLESKTSHVTINIKNLNNNGGSTYKITSQRRHIKFSKL